MTQRFIKWEHVDPERRQAGDLAVRLPVLLERPHRLLQVTAAGNAEDAARRPQTHEQVAADHDHASKRILNVSAAAGSPGGGDSTATSKPRRLV